LQQGVQEFADPDPTHLFLYLKRIAETSLGGAEIDSLVFSAHREVCFYFFAKFFRSPPFAKPFF
jgi:hypothetical protein